MTRQAGTGTQAAQRPLAFFISDLHLQEGHPRTTQAFLDFLARHAPRAQALYLLGDIFEYWAGDDDDDPYVLAMTAALRRVADVGVAVYWMAGNRDFLAGERFAEAAGLTLLPDPWLAHIGPRTVLLAHGDALCTDDAAYMQFRAMVREPEWQRRFLAAPLDERKAVIAGLRAGSREHQRGKSMEIMDVNPDAVRALAAAHGADILVHGHTHRPACHREGALTRYVLPDWELDGAQPRGGWLELAADGTLIRRGHDGAALA